MIVPRNRPEISEYTNSAAVMMPSDDGSITDTVDHSRQRVPLLARAPYRDSFWSQVCAAAYTAR